MDDAELVAAALGGETSSFEELVRRYQDAVFAVALSVTRSYADAQDVTQETFLRAFARLPTLREAAKFGPWVTRIARSVALDVLRAKQRRRELAGRRGVQWKVDEQPQATRPAPIDVTALLSRLSDTLSETVLLYYIDGYSQKEVGELLGVPVGTVKRRLHDARKVLKQEALAMAADELQEKKPGPELPELVSALRRFARELREGIRVIDILKGIAEDVKDERVRNAFDTMYSQVMAGGTLSEVMVRFPDLFPPTVLALVCEGEVCGMLDDTLDSVVEYIETGQFHLPDYRPQGWWGLNQLVEAGREAGARTCVVEVGRSETRLWLVSPEGSRSEFDHRWFRENARRFLYDLRTVAEFGLQNGPEFHGTVRLRDSEGGSEHTYRFTLSHDPDTFAQTLTLDLQPVEA